MQEGEEVSAEVTGGREEEVEGVEGTAEVVEGGAEVVEGGAEGVGGVRSYKSASPSLSSM